MNAPFRRRTRTTSVPVLEVPLAPIGGEALLARSHGSSQALGADVRAYGPPATHIEAARVFYTTAR